MGSTIPVCKKVSGEQGLEHGDEVGEEAVVDHVGKLS